MPRLRIHRQGWLTIALVASVTVALLIVAPLFGFIGLILTVWCVAFFRDPDRVSPTDGDAVLSAADGVILPLEEVSPPPETGLPAEKMRRISVFMNVLNVHVNRIPVSGRIKRKLYRPGRFFNASLDKASRDNERLTLVVKRDDGALLVVTQIAGLLARRIKCDVGEGDALKAGQRFGIIRFGSRVDIYLPRRASVRVLAGQIAVGGETILARLPPAAAS